MTVSRMRFAVLSALVVLAVGCASDPEPRPGPGASVSDAGGSPSDGGPTGGDDAGTTGGTDAGTTGDDAGTTGGTDAGTSGGTDAGTSSGDDGGVQVPADGGTVVRGELRGRLTLAGSPYRVIGDANNVVTIPKGQTTTVEPGVIIDFRGDPVATEADVVPGEPLNVMNHRKGRVELRVYGQIVVSGTADARVAFTSTNPYGWWGLNFFGDESKGDGDPVFDHMVFEKVRKTEYNGDRDRTRGALWAFYTGPVTITNSVFRDNEASAACGALDLMFTSNSVVEKNVFENNRTRDIDRFAAEGTLATSAGGAMCVTHGRYSVVRNNVFRNNRLEAFTGSQWDKLVPRAYLEWPNSEGRYDLGGSAVLHYFQPEHDRIENNTFVDNVVTKGPAAAVYFEHVPSDGATLRGNRFENNKAGAGGVIVCNRGGRIVVTDDNIFVGNTVNGAAAPRTTGDCTVATQTQ